MKGKSLSIGLVCCVFALALGLTACGGGSGSAASAGGSGSAASASANAIDNATLEDGTWKSTGVISASDGKTHELHDVLNAYSMLVDFYSDDECRMYVDTNFTILKWTISGDDIKLSGEGEYHLTVQDGGAKLVWKDFQGTGYDIVFEKSE